jgi:hypothetical protein
MLLCLLWGRWEDITRYCNVHRQTNCNWMLLCLFWGGGRIVQGTVICTHRRTAIDHYCVCYEDVGRIVQGTVMCTDRGTATERYCVCYEEGGRIVQVTVNFTQTKELYMNGTVFFMQTWGRIVQGTVICTQRNCNWTLLCLLWRRGEDSTRTLWKGGMNCSSEPTFK